VRSDGLIAGNERRWRTDQLRLLDIIFARPENAHLRPLETQTRQSLLARLRALGPE
jgi:hypothetical protein